MRILHLGKHYSPARGGIEAALESLARTGLAAGHDVQCIVAAHAKTSSQDELVAGINVRRLASWGKFFSTPLTPATFSEELPAADVVHLHLPNPLWELRLLRLSACDPAFARRLIPYIHALPTGQGMLGKLWFRMITANLLGRVKFSLASNATFVENQPLLAPLRGKIRILPFAVMPKVETAKQNSPGFVLALGRLVPYKGFDVLLRAWKLLALRGKNASMRLLIAGEGPERAHLERLRAELALSAEVEFCGNVNDKEKARLLAAARVFVAPSLTDAETFGIAILEAMAAGKPVVVSDLPTGVRELARCGKSGGLVPPGDPQALSAAIESLISDPARSQAIGRENSAWAALRYSEATLLQAYQAILSEVARD